MAEEFIDYRTFSALSIIWDKFIYDPTFLDKLSVKELLSQLKLSKIPTYVICISLDGCNYSLNADCYRLYLILYEILKALLKGKEFLLTFAHQNCFYISGHLSDLPENRKSIRDYRGKMEIFIKEIIRELQNKEKEFKIHTITVGVDFNKVTSLKTWREMAQHAIVAHRQKVLYGKGNIFWWNQHIIRQNSSSPSNLLPTLGIFNKLLNIIIEREFADIDTFLISLIRDIFRNNLGRLLYLRIQLIEGVILTAHTAIGIGVSDISVSEIISEFIDKVNQLYDPIDLFDITYQTLKKLIDLIKTVPIVTDPIISLVLREIATTEDLTDLNLKKVSEKVFISYSWLSRIFKKRVGISFNKYLNREKCNRAKRLLLYTNKSINDIALNAGFKSIQHFERVFKEVVGVSPSKFRLEYSRRLY